MKRHILQEVPAQAWKNGGGTTRMLASRDPGRSGGAFDWRISVAEIAENGPFSLFPGIDRIAVVLENGPLRLTNVSPVGQLTKSLYVGENGIPLHFPGEIELFGNIEDAAILCLNIMSNRETVAADIVFYTTETNVAVGANVFLFSLSQDWNVGAVSLGKYDTVSFDEETRVLVRPNATSTRPLICITFTDI